MTILRTLPALLLLLWFTGCASTPDKRIQQNQELFDTLPIADQARLRGGQINLGYTPEMVKIAFGEPQRILVRRTPDGESTVWLYLTVTSRYERQRADIDGLSLSGPGGMRSVGGTAWINVRQEREYTRIRVEFRNGVVTAVEEPPGEEPKEQPKS